MFIIIANKKESPNPVAMWNLYKSKEEDTFLYILLPHRFITKTK